VEYQPRVVHCKSEQHEGRNCLPYSSDGGVGASGDDDAAGAPAGDGGAGEEDVVLVLDEEVTGGGIDGLRRLAYASALTGEEGLVTAELAAGDRGEAAVGGDSVTNGEGDDITGNEMGGGNDGGMGVTEGSGAVGLEALKRGEGGVSAGLGGDANGGIGSKDGQNNGGFEEGGGEVLALRCGGCEGDSGGT